MLRIAILALLLAALGAGSLWLGTRGARLVEAAMLARAEQGLATTGADWAELAADGLVLELAGHAPDEAARQAALAAARAAVPFAAMRDHATVALAPPPPRPPLRLELMRDSAGLVITGRLAGRAMRDSLMRRLRAAAPGLEIRDLTGINAARPAAGWGPELAVASLAVVRLPEAHVRVAPGRVAVSGLARDADHRADLTADLIDAAGEAVRLTLELREPPRAAAPFLFAATKGESGGLRVEVCHARDADEAVRLEAALARHGARAGENICAQALGGPEGDWVGAIEAGLAALAELPAGAFRLEYRTAQLEAGPESDAATSPAATSPAATPPAATSPSALPRARARLAAALPEGYGLAGAARVAELETAVAGNAPGYRLSLERGAEGAEVRGLVSGETARRLVATYAEARLGPARVDLAVAPGAADAPAGWEPAALVALDALGTLGRGRAELLPGRLRLEGDVASPAAAGRLHRHLASEAPAGYAVETAFRIDLPAAVAAVPPSASRCAALLDAAIAEAPIGFAPGEAALEPGSDAALDRLAAILADCAGARIEIGGHTDDRGAADLNQRLSRARAEAVLDALIERGVPLARLTARGYGEEEPVADNDTEEGRARNRRIGFKALDCSLRQAAC